MKKLVALLLATLMMVSMFSFASADEPITLQFWHHAGSGGIYNAISAAVNNFNSTVGAEKGIVVEEQYIGAYVDLFAKIQLSVQAGEAPDVAIMANTYVAYGLDEEFLYNMNELAARDGFDTSNILDCFMEIAGNTDGDLYSVPYGRSTPVIFYNKDLVAKAGLNWEDEGYMVRMEELVQLGEAVKEFDANGNQITWGYCLVNDFGYLAAAHIYQLGSSYLAAEGEGAPISQEDGILLKVLADWRQFVDDGIFRAYEATDAGSINQQMLLSGNLAAYPNSCSGMGNLSKKANEAGLNLGVAFYPTYDVNNHVTMIGGCNVSIIKDGTETEESINASWEFIKFLMEDEQVATVHMETGYFPVTKSVLNYQPLADLWANDPRWKVCYDQALLYGKCQETPYHPMAQDYTQICWDNVSLLIQEGSIDAQTAVDNITRDSADIW